MWMKRLVAWTLRMRIWVLLFFLTLTVVSATALPKLRFDFSPEAMLDYSEEELEYESKFFQTFGNTSDSFLVILEAKDTVLSPKGLGDLRDLTNKLSKIPNIISAYSLTETPSNELSGSILGLGELEKMLPAGEVTEETVAKVRERVAESTILGGNLISKDQKYAMVLLSVDEKSKEPAPFQPVMEKTQELVDEWLSDKGDAYEISLGGLPYIRAVTVSTMKTEQLMLWPVVGLFYFLALVLLFRNVLYAALPLISVGCVILWAIGIMVIFNLPITMVNNTMPLLLLVIGVTNSIYVLVRILDERAKGKEKTQSVVDGVSRVALASFLTTSTTAIGFGSLVIAHSPILNTFGAIIALAIMLIYVVLILFMPLLASFLPLKKISSQMGRSASSREETLENHAQAKADASIDAASEIEQEPKNKPNFIDKADALLEQFSEWVGRVSIKHNKFFISLSITLLIVSLFLGLRVPLDSKINDVFEPSHPISQNIRMIEDKLGGILPLEININSEPASFNKVDTLKVISDLQEKISKIDGVIVTLSVINIINEAGIHFQNEAPSQLKLTAALAGIKRFQSEQLRAFMTDDASNIHISVRLPDNGVKKSKKTINEIQEACNEAKQKLPSLDFRFTGTGYTSTMGLEAFVNDLFSSLLTAFFIIFFILFISFRSFWAGLASVLPNLLPLVMTLAMMNIYGYELNTTSVLVFTISIGLAVDNSIHIISRFRQEYRFGRSVEEAIIRAMRSSGRAILQSNVLLISGLAILLFSSFEPISRVGLLTMTTIAAALVVALFVLPAELMQIGHRMAIKEKRST